MNIIQLLSNLIFFFKNKLKKKFIFQNRRHGQPSKSPRNPGNNNRWQPSNLERRLYILPGLVLTEPAGSLNNADQRTSPSRSDGLATHQRAVQFRVPGLEHPGLCERPPRGSDNKREEKLGASAVPDQVLNIQREQAQQHQE